MGYNEILRSYVWQDLIEIFRKEPGAMDGSRDNYRNTAIRQQKKSAKNTEKGKQKKEKVQLPHDHQLLTKETYPQLQTTMWTYLDNVVNTYKQKFLKDIKDGQQIKGLIDHYFLFIFIQMLVQSKVVFDTKRPQSNPFIQQVIDDCISHLDGVHGVSLSISSESIKKKLFHTVDETSIPLELLYKNSMEEDILDRERYFNIYFFTSQKTSVDHIRRQIMLERKENSEKMRL